MLPGAPWLCWGIPIIGAMLTPLMAKVHPKVRDYGSVLFSFVGFLFAASMIPNVFAGNVPYQSGILYISVPILISSVEIVE